MNTLREAVQEYLTLRRSLGFKLREDGARLADFATFMEQRKASYITHKLALAWAQEPKALPSEWARRLGFVRVFARHRSATDSRTQIPPTGLLPYPATRIRPYIYSDREIRALLDAALNMRCRTVGFLDHLEKNHGLSIRSRNLRLTAIHSFFRYAALEAPDHDHENVKNTKPNRVQHKEVTAPNGLGLVLQKASPGLGISRSRTPFDHVSPDG